MFVSSPGRVDPWQRNGTAAARCCRLPLFGFRTGGVFVSRARRPRRQSMGPRGALLEDYRMPQVRHMRSLSFLLLIGLTFIPAVACNKAETPTAPTPVPTL